TLYDQLSERNLANPSALEEFLRDWNELGDVLGEEENRRYVSMTCQTDDQAAAEAYKFYITDIAPRRKPRENELEKHYLASPARNALPPERYAVFDREVATRAALFREANVPLETQESLRAQEYQTVVGAMTVQFDGEEKTLPQLYPVLEETDRARREAAWRAVAERRYQERDQFDELFEQLRDLRVQIARNAGYDNYRDYMFVHYQRFDYTPDDCYQFHDAVEAHAVPLLRKVQARRREQMGLDSVRPWDTAVDPLGRAPLRPFQSARELIDGCTHIFAQVDSPLADQLLEMEKHCMLDLENRKGKAPGGYQTFFSESRIPFIFMNAVGTDGDVNTLLHEGGHAFNAFATRDEWLASYRHPPMEFCEVASMGMELLGRPYLEAFYSLDDANRSRTQHLESIVSVLPWIATIDAFQHWLYTHPTHTREERRAEWANVYRRFAGDMDWRGLEALMQTTWHRQLHIFEVPFYYIEYGIAQLGALQIYRNMQQDHRAAVKSYERALALGGCKPLPQLFEAADIRFDFSADTVQPLMEMVARELEL
ncbi:MAG: M3 family oligoendopeptidase, partial [Chloroflexi bacterium]|nr:M3 family oligoendopeptidase [Chloroflexota bacterium]